MPHYLCLTRRSKNAEIRCAGDAGVLRNRDGQGRELAVLYSEGQADYGAESADLDGKRVQLLDIYYSGVGILHKLTPEEMEEAFQQHLTERNKEKTA